MDHRPGITLIELLVYIGVSTIVLLAFTGLAFSLLATHAQTKTSVEITASANQALMIMSHEIEHAYSIDPASSLGINIAQSSGTVLFHTQEPARNPLAFSVSGGGIQLAKGTQAAQRLTPTDSTVTQLTFTNLSSANGKSKHVRIVLTLRAPVGYGIQSFENTFSTSVELKDYAQ